MSDWSEGDFMKRAASVQGYPISNNQQMFRNAERSVAAGWSQAAVTWPSVPLQLFEEAITWRVTSAAMTNERNLSVRGADARADKVLDYKPSDAFAHFLTANVPAPASASLLTFF